MALPILFGGIHIQPHIDPQEAGKPLRDFLDFPVEQGSDRAALGTWHPARVKPPLYTPSGFLCALFCRGISDWISKEFLYPILLSVIVPPRAPFTRAGNHWIMSIVTSIFPNAPNNYAPNIITQKGFGNHLHF